jgi:hypothetical protein
MLNGTRMPAVYREPTDYAIVVGINHYKAGIPTLQGAVNDAGLFRRWLIDPHGGGLDPNHVTFICSANPPNGRPLREEIEDAILGYYAWQNETGRARGRRLYLYFAGHGVTPNAPNDEDCGLVMANAILLALRALPGRLAAKRIRRAALFEEIVLFMDCCRQVTGQVVAECGLPDFGDPLIAARKPYFYAFAADWALTATERELPHPFDPDEPSLVQGVFTYAVLRGLTSAIDEQSQEITSMSLKKFVIDLMLELLPEQERAVPYIELSEHLPPIRFGKGRRIPLEIRTAAQVVSVVVQDGLDLRQIAVSHAPDGSGAFRFELFPARYAIAALDAANNVIRGPQPVQVLGASVSVNL